MRASLLERGFTIRQGARFVQAALPDILGRDAEHLSPRMVQVIGDAAKNVGEPGLRIDVAELCCFDQGRRAA